MPAARRETSAETAARFADLVEKRTGARPDRVFRLVQSRQRVARDRAEAGFYCAKCERDGHRSEGCSSVPRPPRSHQAANWALGTGAPLDVAGRRFGLTRSAVSHAWGVLGYKRRVAGRPSVAPTPILELAAAGRSVTEIAEAAKCTRATVRNVCRRAGVEIVPAGRAARQAAMARALEAVRQGATLIDAASEHGVSTPRLSLAAKSAGVRVVTRKYGDRMDGRSQRAIARVLSGESVAEACRKERTATGYVWSVLAKRRAREDG